MKKLVAVGLILLSVKVYAQQNFVPNGSFEDVQSCPWDISQLYLAEPWFTTIAGSPDLYNGCHQGIPLGVPENGIGQQEARSGAGYAGIFAYGGQHEQEGREYLQVQLIEPIQSNIDYLVSFWASLADKNQYAVSSLGAYFSDTLITRTEFNSILNVEPSIENHYDSILGNKDIWHHVTDTFRSRYGGEQYLLIGNFRTAAESNLFWVDSGAGPNWDRSYYYIDDVSVVALDSVPSSVEDIDAEQNNFSVYPNPANQYATVAFDVPTAEGPLSVLVVDVQGRIVKTIPLSGQTDQTVIDTDGLGSGTYHFLLVDGNNSLASFEVSIVR